MTKLRISEDLALPIDFVVGTEADLATKGMGKSHLAQVIAEELLEHGQVFAAIDPTDAWWGLRSSADGKSDGYQVTVFGGDHADIQLEPDAGVALADFVMEERRPIIICTEGLTQSGEVRVVREFLERIYRKNREPLKLFVDEADMFAPQKPDDPEDAKSIRAMRNIVRRGRKKGIGCMMITQRPAELNKGVLNMCDTLFVLGMESPLDIDPIEKWTRSKEPKVRAIADEMIDSLTTLPVGDAWVVKKRAGLFKRFRARAKRTFDSGATPKPGQRAPVAKKLAPIDLKVVGERIAAMVERQRAEDPKLLKARVAELEKDITRMKAAALERPTAKAEIKTVEKPVVKEAQLQRLGVLIEQGDGLVNRIRDVAGAARQSLDAVCDKAAAFGLKLEASIGELRNGLRAATTPNIPGGRPALSAPAATRNAAAVTIRREAVSRNIPAGDGVRLPPGEAATLRAALQFPNGLQRAQLTVLTQYKRSSRDAYIQRLREKGLLDVSGDRVTATAAGAAAMPNAEPLPTGQALQEHWLRELPEGERAVLTVLLAHEGAEISREEIDAQTGYQRSSRDAYLQRLKAKELVIPLARGLVKASPNLFEVQ